MPILLFILCVTILVLLAGPALAKGSSSHTESKIEDEFDYERAMRETLTDHAYKYLPIGDAFWNDAAWIAGYGGMPYGRTPSGGYSDDTKGEGVGRGATASGKGTSSNGGATGYVSPRPTVTSTAPGGTAQLRAATTSGNNSHPLGRTPGPGAPGTTSGAASASGKGSGISSGIDPNKVESTSGFAVQPSGASASGKGTSVGSVTGPTPGSLAGDFAQGVANQQALLGDMNGTVGAMRDSADYYNNIARSGEVPDVFMENFAQGIKGATDRTIGSTMNTMANNGILNSRVTQGSMAEIGRDVNEAAARHYLDAYTTNLQGLSGSIDQYGKLLSGQQTLLGEQLTPAMSRLTGVGALYGLGQGFLQPANSLYELWRTTRYQPTKDTVVEQSGPFGK